MSMKRCCGDCPFFYADRDLCSRTPLPRGTCDVDVERPRRTHVRRAMCERAREYFTQAPGEGGKETL